MTADPFRRHIKGRRKGPHNAAGSVCPCCREDDKRGAARLARARLREETRAEVEDPENHNEKEIAP